MHQPLYYHVLMIYSTGALLREIFLTLYRAKIHISACSAPMVSVVAEQRPRLAM